MEPPPDNCVGGIELSMGLKEVNIGKPEYISEYVQK